MNCDFDSSAAARIRWDNVARASALLAAVGLAVLWPRLGGSPPAVPASDPVPVVEPAVVGGAAAGAAPRPVERGARRVERRARRVERRRRVRRDRTGRVRAPARVAPRAEHVQAGPVPPPIDTEFGP